jgi:hypothetical protein
MAAQYHAATDRYVHPTNIGQIAQRLALDYLQQGSGRRYGAADIPAIFAELDALVADRRRYDQYDC